MVDLIPKLEIPSEKLRLQRGENSWFFYLVLVLFIIVLSVYGAVVLLNRSQLEAQKILVEEAQTKEQELRTELLNQVFFLDRRLKGTRGLLDNHIFSTNAFKIVEKDTLPQVQFINFQINTDNRKIDMSGEAASYLVLAQQIGVLERDPQIEKVEFGGLSTNGNKVGFKVAVILKPTVLKTKPQ